MRGCVRCGSDMVEGCDIRIEASGNGIVLSSDKKKLFGGRLGRPKAAIRPECGEVSIYPADPGALRR